MIEIGQLFFPTMFLFYHISIMLEREKIPYDAICINTYKLQIRIKNKNNTGCIKKTNVYFELGV